MDRQGLELESSGTAADSAHQHTDRMPRGVGEVTYEEGSTEWKTARIAFLEEMLRIKEQDLQDSMQARRQLAKIVKLREAEVTGLQWLVDKMTKPQMATDA
jgi:hypothetical protein